MSVHQAGFLDVLRSAAGDDGEARTSAKTLFSRLFGLTLFLDLLCSVLFVFESAGWRAEGVRQSWNDANLLSFSTQAWDCVLLTLSRCLLFPLVTLFTVRLGSPYDTSSQPSQQKGRGKLPTNSSVDGKHDLYAPLVCEPCTSPLSGNLPPNGKGTEEENEQAATVAAASASNDAASRGKAWRHFGVAVLFLLSTAYQLYVGLKVSAYKFGQGDEAEKSEDGSKNDDDDAPHGGYTAEAVLLCVSVLWINLEVFALRTLVAELTRKDGLFLPDVHPHPLFVLKGVALHWCDVCSTRIKDGASWRCKLCDFDMCTKCASRKDVGTVGENLMRGDKGRRTEEAISSTAYLKRALGLAAADSPLLFWAFALLFAYTATNLALPDYQGRIIDQVSQGHRSEFIQNVQVYLTIMALQGFFSAGYSAAFGVVSRRILFAVRTKMFNNVLGQDVAFFDGTTSGHLTSRMTNDVNTMMEPIRSSLSTLLYNSITLTGSVAMCYYTSYELSMLAFVTVGPIMYLWDLYGHWSKSLTRRMLSAMSEGNSLATEALSHIRTVKAFASEPMEKALYLETSTEALRLGILDSLGYGATSALTGYLDLGAGVLILWYGGKLVLDGDQSGSGHALTIGKLVTFQLYWNMMNSAYQSLQGLITSFTRSAAAAEKVFALMDSVADIGGQEKASPSSSPSSSNSDNQSNNKRYVNNSGILSEAPKRIDWNLQGEFEFKNVEFYYQMRPDNLVLNGLNLVIPAKSVCALVGRSGGGKSTLIAMLMRFYDPRQGSLSLDGRELRSLQVSDLRRQIGVVAQDTPLFARSVVGNITYGLEPHEYTMDQVEDAARKAQCHDFIVAMKDGYETRVGERGGRLSGGQRQRIAIARIFLRQPKICLLDEATSALDEDSQAAVQASLDSLIASGGATVVLVAHRLSTVMGADKIAVIDGGQVLEEGNHASLVQQGGVYASLVKKQTAKIALVEAGSEKESYGASNGTGSGSKRGGASNGGGGAGNDSGKTQTIDQLMDGLRASELKAPSASTTISTATTQFEPPIAVAALTTPSGVGPTESTAAASRSRSASN